MYTTTLLGEKSEIPFMLIRKGDCVLEDGTCYQWADRHYMYIIPYVAILHSSRYK